MSKEDQKNLSKDNNASFNTLKKVHVRIVKKIGTNLTEYKKKRKTETELEEDLANIIKKSEKKGEESDDDDIDILELMKRDEDKEPAVRRLKWVKKEKTEDKKAKKGAEEEKNKKKQNIQASKLYEMDDENKVEEEEVLTQADIEKEYDQISKQRGQNKSNIDVVQRIEFLFSKTPNKFLQIKLLTLSNLLCFDNYTNQLTAFPFSLWDKVYKDIETLIELHDTLMKEKTDEQNKEADYMSLSLQNNLSTMMEKFENELYKSLQFNMGNSKDFTTCILNEIKFLKLCKKAENFYSNVKNMNGLGKIFLLIIMHTYYKTEASVKIVMKKNNLKFEDDEYIKKIILDNDKNYFTSLCSQAYRLLDEENKVKVMLYQIFFLCLRNDYESASKLFNSSNLFELITVFKNEPLKILFNRTLAQLSLCAFKNLDLEEVLRYLTPLCTKGPSKIKEYLSQSYSKDSEKNVLFDREDKKRAIPSLMKINVEDLDTIFYLSSMICDASKILLDKIYGINPGTEYNYNAHAFERMFYNFQRQQFDGPSNIDKDIILATTSLLMRGDWKRCIQEIKKLNLIKKYSNLQEKLFELIKRVALKCYILFYMTEYQSFALDKLAKRFEIEVNEVKNIINDMILRRQIKAKWNDNYLLMKSNDRDSIVNMKKLMNNVQIITKQNLELMEAALALSNSE
jgi:translation initiation factor 3 subunit C